MKKENKKTAYCAPKMEMMAIQTEKGFSATWPYRPSGSFEESQLPDLSDGGSY